MTREEAIDILEEVKELDDSIYQYNTNYLKALEMAIKALEQEPSGNAVSRQAVKDLLVSNGIYGYGTLIDKLPSVKLQEKVGHWITTRTFMHDGEFYCDKCKCESPNNEKWDYCPNCGIRMVGDDNENSD